MSIAARRRAWQERLESQKQQEQWRTERDLTLSRLDAAEKRGMELEQQLRTEREQMLDQLNSAESRHNELEQQLRTKHNQSLGKLSAAEKRAKELELEKETLMIQLRQAKTKAKIAAENKELKESYEEKLTYANQAMLNALNRASAAESALDAQQAKPPHRLFADFVRSFWQRYFVEHKGDSPIDSIRKSICVLLLVLVIGYLLLDQVHWVFLHTSLAFDGAPCAERIICQVFPCNVADMHRWQHTGCMTPKTCSICGAKTGGTNSHLWCDAEGSETVCHLCPAIQTDTYFYRIRRHMDELESSYSGFKHTFTFPEGSELISVPIVILDYTGEEFLDYTQSWDGRVLTIEFQNVPFDGAYQICADTGARLTALCDLFYGKYNSLTPESTGDVLTDFHIEHLLTGRYLCADNGTLTSVSPEDWKKSSAFSDLSKLFVDGADSVHWTRYLYISEVGEQQWYYAFEQDGKYLAVQADGTVYWSDVFTDECCWML